jgi:lipoprotein-releasing system ATP-binding protein
MTASKNNPDREPILEVKQVHRTFKLGRVTVPVLRGASLNVIPGQWLAILGASGSGKSTLLHLCGGLDRPDRDAGEIRYRGQNVNRMSAAELNNYRNTHVGFVFQFYHLLPELNVLENTTLAAMVRYGHFGYRMRRSTLEKEAGEILDRFGLSARLKHKPAELSGGERQRVALARALMNKPALLLADEPTGNLDAVTGGQILDVIAQAHREGQTIVMVTHDQAIADRADRVLNLVDGIL